jgi:hypothetical protein
MPRHLMPVLVVATLIVGAAMAQQSQTPATPQQPPTAIPPATNQNPGLRAPAETRPGEPARATNPGGIPGAPPSDNEPVNIATAVHSADLIGATVRNERNENIGTVEALLISPDGKVAGVVLDVGGFLGMGARQVVVPMAQLSMVGKDVRLTEGSKNSLRALPPYQRRMK